MRPRIRGHVERPPVDPEHEIEAAPRMATRGEQGDDGVVREHKERAGRR
jgi:hypothetical protein